MENGVAAAAIFVSCRPQPVRETGVRHFDSFICSYITQLINVNSTESKLERKGEREGEGEGEREGERREEGERGRERERGGAL